MVFRSLFNCIELRSHPLNTCQDSLFYVGGEGQIEDSLWDEIKRLSKEMKREGIVYPDYEAIECVKEDWA